MIRFSDAPRGTCRWCGEPIVHARGPKRGEPNRRRRWHPSCLEVYEQSDPREARRLVRKRDRGRCASCGLDTIALQRELRGRGRARAMRERGFKPRQSLWELDHVVPLIDGGGHDLANLQTLCTPCHKGKTGVEAAARSARRQENELERSEASVLEEADRALRSSERLLARLASDAPFAVPPQLEGRPADPLGKRWQSD